MAGFWGLGTNPTSRDSASAYKQRRQRPKLEFIQLSVLKLLADALIGSANASDAEKFGRDPIQQILRLD